MSSDQPMSTTFRRQKKVMVTLYLLIVCLGVWQTIIWKNKAQEREHEHLLQIAQSIARTVEIERVQHLSFDASDAEKLAYQQLENQLSTYAETVGLHTLYMIAQNGDDLVYGPGSKQPTGQQIESPTPSQQKAIESERASCETVADGNVWAACAPIQGLDATKSAAIYLELDESIWAKQLRLAILLPTLFAILPAGLLLLGWLIYHRQIRTSYISTKKLRNIQVITWSLMMLLLTGFATLHASNKDKRERTDRFQAEIDRRSARYQNIFSSLHNALHLITRFMDASEYVTPEEFSQYCQIILNQTEVSACLWLPQVAAPESTQFQQQIEQQTGVPFSIRSFLEDAPPVETEKLYPAAYVEPKAQRSELQGYDFYSHPTFCQAIDKALQNRSVSAAILNTSPTPTLNLFIFEPRDSPSTTGLVCLSIDLDGLIDNLNSIADGSTVGISATLFGLIAGEQPSALGCSACDDHRYCKKTIHSEFATSVPIFIFGKTFMVNFSAEPTGLQAQHPSTALMTFIIGIALTGVLSYIVFLQSNRPIQLEELVNERTKKLAETQHRCDIATNAANMGIWELDLSNNMLRFDKKLALMFEKDPTQLIRPFQDFLNDIHPEDQQLVIDTLKTVRRGKQPMPLEFRIPCSDGSFRYILAFGETLYDENGKADQLIGTNQDITTQKEMERNLRESEENFRDMVETLPLAIYLAVGVEQNLEYMNPAFRNLFGYIPEEIPNAAEWFKRAYPDPEYSKKVETEWMQKVQHAAETQSPIEPMETSVRCKDGSDKTIVWGHIPMGNKNYAYGLDLTELKRTEQELRTNESFLKSVIDLSPFPMWVADPTGTLIRANQALCSALNLTRENLVGNYNVLKDKNLEGEMRKKIKRVFHFHESAHLTTFWKADNVGGGLDLSQGRNVYINASIIPVVNTEGDLTHVVCQWVDITERKEAEERLRNSNDELSRFNKVAVGRELRMIELKQEINALCRKIKAPEPYPQANQESEGG